MKEKIQSLLKTSKKVIKDCCLSNGAIVAANSSKAYFPKEGKNYKFVWLRDAAYICIAAKILDIKIQEKFFKWCLKAEGWEKTGLFYEKYFVNGKKARFNFQPDQTGSVLLSVFDYYKDSENLPKNVKKLIKKSANGLCSVWNKDHFYVITQDLWEERLCFPDLKESFSYSLAACSAGLLCANELIPNKRWNKAGEEMKRALLKNKGYFYRSLGKINDKRVDASLLGLVWPFGIVKADYKRMEETLRIIEDKIVKDHGVHRYEHDEYDGWMYKGKTQRKKGSGYWPLLNFWMSIYYAEKGDKKKALKYYNKVLHDLRSDYIPEQIFNNNLQISVSPLCWSHAMFVIASKKLGYL